LCRCISQSITIKSEFTKNPVIEERTVGSEFLPDLTRIMNETKMTLMAKHFEGKITMKQSVPTSLSGVPSVY
jgi:hypothetical protein